MDAWIQALEDSNCEDVANVDEHIKIDDEELELYHERADTTEYRLKIL